MCTRYIAIKNAASATFSQTQNEFDSSNQMFRENWKMTTIWRMVDVYIYYTDSVIFVFKKISQGIDDNHVIVKITVELFISCKRTFNTRWPVKLTLHRRESTSNEQIKINTPQNCEFECKHRNSIFILFLSRRQWHNTYIFWAIFLIFVLWITSWIYVCICIETSINWSLCFIVRFNVMTKYYLNITK